MGHEYEIYLLKRKEKKKGETVVENYSVHLLKQCTFIVLR